MQNVGFLMMWLKLFYKVQSKIAKLYICNLVNWLSSLFELLVLGFNIPIIKFTVMLGHFTDFLLYQS